MPCCQRDIIIKHHIFPLSWFSKNLRAKCKTKAYLCVEIFFNVQDRIPSSHRSKNSKKNKNHQHRHPRNTITLTMNHVEPLRPTGSQKNRLPWARKTIPKFSGCPSSNPSVINVASSHPGQ